MLKAHRKAGIHPGGIKTRASNVKDKEDRNDTTVNRAWRSKDSPHQVRNQPHQ